MKRFCLVVAVTASGVLIWAAPALAQGSSVKPEPLSWATGDKVDWSKGGLLALFGLAGALFTVFTLVGGVVPGTAGQATVEADTKRLEVWTLQLEKQITRSGGCEAPCLEAINNSVSALRSAVTRERWRQFLLASVLYVLLGAFVAAALTQDLVQAAAIGAGWTGIVGSLGLKRDYSKRSDTKDEAIAALKDHIDRVVQKAEAPAVEVTAEEARPSQDLLTQIEVARAL
jgi:hypothetical protein